MNTTLDISSAGQMLTPAQAPTIPLVLTKSGENAKAAISAALRPSLWRAGVILKGFAVILAALYVVGASALCAALLFYTLIH